MEDNIKEVEAGLKPSGGGKEASQFLPVFLAGIL